MLPVLLFALCRPQLLLQTPIAMCRVAADDGAIYDSICGMPQIRRLDQTVVFESDTPVSDWDVEHGVLAVATPHGITVAFPNGARREISQDFAVQRIQVRDGFVYWFSPDEGLLRRAPLGGGSPETVAITPGLNSRVLYAVFEDRLVFVDATGLYVKPIVGGALARLLARTDIDAIAGVSAEGIRITTSRPDFNGGSAQLLFVPWAGAPVTASYEVATTGVRTGVTLTALRAGATTYIAQYVTIGCCSAESRLLVLRDGLPAERRFSSVGPLTLIDGDEESVRVGRWINASGMVRIEEICAAPSKTRAVSR